MSSLSEHPNKLLRLSQVRELTGVSRPTIYRWASEGHFPKPVRIGPRASAWIYADVLDWLQSRAHQSNKDG